MLSLLDEISNEIIPRNFQVVMQAQKLRRLRQRWAWADQGHPRQIAGLPRLAARVVKQHARSSVERDVANTCPLVAPDLSCVRVDAPVCWQ